ncbi:MAG: radical SAM/SPASM domain-containing protein [Nanobdellota archaeon]
MRRFWSKLHIVLRRPRLFPRLLKNYFMLFTGKQRLRTVEIALTYECQCNCAHCSAEQLKDTSKSPLSLREIKHCIDEAIFLGAIHILFTGGETLLSGHLPSLVRYASERNCIVSIDTNGQLFDDAMGRTLAHAGLDVACISIDSLQPGVHEGMRNCPGLLEKAIKAVDICRKHGIHPIISTLITKQSLAGEVEEILEFAAGKCAEVIFCLPVSTKTWQLPLDRRDMKRVMQLLKHKSARICAGNNYLSMGCAAGSEKIALTLYGDMMPCSFLNEPFGNVQEESFGSVLGRVRKKRRYSRVNRDVMCLAAKKT